VFLAEPSIVEEEQVYNSEELAEEEDFGMELDSDGDCGPKTFNSSEGEHNEDEMNISW
jgi:hypothetical protein